MRSSVAYEGSSRAWRRLAPSRAFGGRRLGFTVVELMVAVTAGLAVALAAYTLSKTSVDVFQQEARMNAAQFSSMMGMNRLTTDIKRAGFQTTPQVDGDPNVCVLPGSNEPERELLSALRIYDGETDATHGFSTNTYGSGSAVGASGDYPALPAAFGDSGNNRFPDRLRLAANFTASTSFRVSRIEAPGRVWLDIDQLPVQRLFQQEQTGGIGICDIFAGLRVPDADDDPTNDPRPIDLSPAAAPAVRILDNAGRTRFAILTTCNSTMGTDNYTTVTMEIATLPSGPACTALDIIGPGYINPVHFVDYAVVAAADLGAVGLPASVASLVNEEVGLDTVTGANTRAFLVRREIDAEGTPIPGTAEAISDYVVDLNFSLRSRTPAGVTVVAPFDGTPAVGTIPTNQIRTVGVRLSTRARNPDRPIGQATVPGSDQALARFNVFAGTTSNVANRFARVRTMFSEITLPNMQGESF